MTTNLVFLQSAPKYYSAFKRREIMTQATTRVNLEELR